MSILTEVEPEWYVARKVAAVLLDVQLCAIGYWAKKTNLVEPLRLKVNPERLVRSSKM